MAGAKETPRQKMIGMMYLVLTAMLALNVSNSVLDKFILINKSLEHSVAEKDVLNTEVLNRIKKAVADAGNRPKDLAVLEQAEKVRVHTDKTIKELERYKDIFIIESGGRDENGNLEGKKDIDIVPTIMTQSGGGVNYKGKVYNGTALKKEINGYSEYLREVTGQEHFHNLALDAKEMPEFKNDPEQKIKSFADLHFGYNTPMVGALASVSQMQTEILNQETLALDDLARSVGAGDLKFDRIIPMVLPESQTVASGATYRAEMFIAASSSAVNPTMTLDGKPISVVEGKGKIEFKAIASSFDAQGLAEKSFEAAIRVQSGGIDTTFVDTKKYYVVKPVIQIQSASVQALYLGCGNEISVQVPSLGTNYKPTFTLQGNGQIIKGNKKGLITIIPRAKKVSLLVYNEGNFMGKQDFGVRRIPKPEIKTVVKGRVVTATRAIPAPRIVQLQAEADESFEQFLPKDAKFRVSAATITLVRSGRAVATTRAKGPKVNTSSLAAQARSGDNYVIEIKQVQRKDFRGRIEEFNKYAPAIMHILIK